MNLLDLVIKTIHNFKSLFTKRYITIKIPKLDDTKEKEITCDEIENKLNILLETTNLGDIIWAKRYFSEEEKSNILKGHRVGPFLVIGKREKGLICIQGTSIVPDELNFDKYFEVLKDNYSLLKDTYFRLRSIHIIDNSTYIKTISCLNKNDLNSFLKLLKKDYKYNKRYSLELPLQLGDIVKYNKNKYIILNILEDKLLCLPVTSTTKINNTNLNTLNFNKLIYLDRNLEFQFIYTLSDNLLSTILTKLHKYLEHLKIKKIPQRGSVIYIDKKLYYIYGEIALDWQVFRIYGKIDEAIDIISIDGLKFSTSYEEATINKKANFSIITLAFEDEIENIKNSRNYYKKRSRPKTKVKTVVNKKLFIGNVIEHRYYNSERFIILNINNNNYHCIAINKLQNGINEIMEFRKKDITLSHNQSIKGIVWLDNNPNFDFNNIDLFEIIETQQKFLNGKSLQRKKS